MTIEPKPDLGGIGVVLTRPRAQAEKTAQALRSVGARAIVFPALELAALPLSPADRELIAALDGARWIIFISQNAVEFGVQAIKSVRDWPAGPRLAAVGGSTADTLTHRGLKDAVSPARGADSEALLALPELQNVQGQRIVIVRGAGGRETLREELTARGADVRYLECYERRAVNADNKALMRAWEQGEVQAVSAMSEETLRNFLQMVGPEGRRRMADTALFVPHSRIAEAARAEGCREVFVTDIGDAGLVKALQLRFSRAFLD